MISTKTTDQFAVLWLAAIGQFEFFKSDAALRVPDSTQLRTIRMYEPPVRMWYVARTSDDPFRAANFNFLSVIPFQ